MSAQTFQITIIYKEGKHKLYISCKVAHQNKLELCLSDLFPLQWTVVTKALHCKHMHVWLIAVSMIQGLQRVLNQGVSVIKRFPVMGYVRQV